MPMADGADQPRREDVNYSKLCKTVESSTDHFYNTVILAPRGPTNDNDVIQLVRGHRRRKQEQCQRCLEVV